MQEGQCKGENKVKKKFVVLTDHSYIEGTNGFNTNLY